MDGPEAAEDVPGEASHPWRNRLWVALLLVAAACRSNGATSSDASASAVSPGEPAAPPPATVRVPDQAGTELAEPTEPTEPTEPAEPGPYDGDYYDGPRCTPPATYAEGPKADPAKAGCADGQRELFADAAQFPDIAGCLGDWTGMKDLSAKPTATACGDDLGQCAVPADACAPGWHVCGFDGNTRDLGKRVTADQCALAGPGRFAAAISHLPDEELTPCPTIEPDAVMPCTSAGLGSEPVCCGEGCQFGKCRDTVWPDQTRIVRGTAEGCGAVTSECSGVLCCRDVAA